MNLLKLILSFAIAVILHSCSIFKKANKPTSSEPPLVVTIAKDSAKKSTIKPYKEIVTDKAVTSKGLINVHKVEDKYFFEIADTIFEKDLLIVTRIAKAATGIRPMFGLLGYSGDLINQSMIRFCKGPNNKVFIKQMSFIERALDSSINGMYKAVANSNLQPLVASFDVKAFTPDSMGVVLELTDFLNGDNKILFFGDGAKNLFKVQAIQVDRSFISKIETYPLNVEITTNKTYNRGDDGSIGTYELNTSLVLLPTKPMKPRYWDERVGFFPVSYIDYDAPQKVKGTQLITRWRLEPKPEDVDRYMNGNLVEPQKPIIYFIDPCTPKKWVPYLIQGVNDWQKAFEKAGFKNAIYALEAPENDSTWSLYDARHNAIIYKPSFIANASGPHVGDPRTGEILESHINWYHNVMKLLQNWYMIQAGPNDPRARKMEFDDELMGQLIRFVSSHEVGHTLGLMHNFGASSTIPVERLRDKKWVEEHGFCPSIMDYARFNYVAQPEDSISAKGIMPRIGPYDEWAIEWGYKWLPELKNEKEERAFMNEWIIDRVKADNRLWFGDESGYFDPRRQAEAVGDDPIRAGHYGICNLKRIVPQLIEWTSEPNSDYESLKDVRRQAVGQFSRYLFHVATLIGGRMYTPKTVEEPGKLVDFVSREDQKRAIKFLQAEVFETPVWLMNKNIFDVIGGPGFWELWVLQRDVLERVTSAAIFNNQLYAQLNSGMDKSKIYTIDELLTDLESGIWKELNGKLPVDPYRRALQKLYADRLIGIMQFRVQQRFDLDTYWNNFTDASTVVKSHIKKLIDKINRTVPYFKDEATRNHLVDIRDRLKKELNPLTSGTATAAALKLGLNGQETDIRDRRPAMRSCWDDQLYPNLSE